MSAVEVLKQMQISPFIRIPQDKVPSQNRENALQFSTERLNALEKYIHDEIQQTKSYITNEDESLDILIKHLSEFLNNLNNKIKQNYEITQELNSEVEASTQKANKFKSFKPTHNEEELKQEMTQLKKQIVQYNSKRAEITNNLVINDFVSLNIKNLHFDSPVNDLFRWVIMVFYKDPATNYHWPNFKKEAFLNDGGADFKSRLSKVRLVDLKIDEVERTKHIVKRKENILNDPLILPATRQTYEGLFKIADITLETHETGNKVHKIEILQKNLTFEVQQNQNDAQKLNEYINIIQERLSLQKTINQAYTTIAQSISHKIQSYRQAQTHNQSMIQEIIKEHNNLDITQAYQIPAPVFQELQQAPVIEVFEPPILQQQEPEQQIIQNDLIQLEVNNNEERVEKNEVTNQEEQQIYVEQQQQVAEVNAGLTFQTPATEIKMDRQGGCNECIIF